MAQPIEPVIFYTSNYETRADLEAHIKSKVGQDMVKNKDAGIEIRGTKKELKKLSLSDSCTVWGCKVVSTYGSTEKDLKEKLEKKGKEWKL